MNTIDKVLALANAGYTKDEISQLLSAGDPEQREAAPEPEPKPEPKPEPEPKPQQVTGMDALNARLDKLIQRMEQESINRSQQPPKETTDDILASIIRPTTRKE